MKLLITGGSGYLGRALTPIAQSAYTWFSHDPLALPGGTQLDLRDADAVLAYVKTLQPDAIIHTAGSNRTPDMTNVIVEGTRNVLSAAKSVGARLIHLSTDVVFDGTSGPYREDDKLTPVHAYGLAKAEAEMLMASYDNFVIVRTSLIVGLAAMDMGTQWMAAALAKGEPVTLFRNHLRNPISAETLSQALIELAGNMYCGILHVAGRSTLTREQVGRAMLDYWQVPNREKVVAADDHSGRWPVDCRLDIGRAANLLQTPLFGLDEILAKVDRKTHGDARLGRA